MITTICTFFVYYDMNLKVQRNFSVMSEEKYSLSIITFTHIINTSHKIKKKYGNMIQE